MEKCTGEIKFTYGASMVSLPEIGLYTCNDKSLGPTWMILCRCHSVPLDSLANVLSDPSCICLRGNIQRTGLQCTLRTFTVGLDISPEPQILQSNKIHRKTNCQ